MLAKLKDQEEEAKFSRMLAEIRRDAPIDFVVPKERWREGVDSKMALDMLARFDFRALMPRVKTALGTPAEHDTEKISDSSLRTPDQIFSGHVPPPERFQTAA